jgi:hypothetical protein
MGFRELVKISILPMRLWQAPQVRMMSRTALPSFADNVTTIPRSLDTTNFPVTDYYVVKWRLSAETRDRDRLRLALPCCSSFISSELPKLGIPGHLSSDDSQGSRLELFEFRIARSSIEQEFSARAVARINDRSLFRASKVPPRRSQAVPGS